MRHRGSTRDPSQRHGRSLAPLTLAVAAVTCTATIAACGSSTHPTAPGASHSTSRLAFARGAAVPGRTQHPSRGDPVASVQSSRDHLPQAAARRRSARGNLRKHEAQHAGVRQVPARAWRSQLPRPVIPQPRPDWGWTPSWHQHRLPGVQASGSRLRRHVKTQPAHRSAAPTARPQLLPALAPHPDPSR
jgi:hypothetical protein